MECDQLPAPRTWEQAAPAALDLYRTHVRLCTACRARVLAEAPDHLLFDIRRQPLPEDFWLGFWNSVQQKNLVGKEHVYVLAPVRWAAVVFIGLMILLYGRNLPETERLQDPVQNQAVKIEAQHYPVIENLSNPEARYYIFQSGEQSKIVMVFDPEMEL